VRSSEYAAMVVMVSDEPIPEPEPPPPPPDFAELQAAWEEQQAIIEAQQLALNNAIGVNSAQSQLLNEQSQRLNALANQLNLLQAKVDAGPGSGNPIPPDLADDLPLAEADGVVLGTNAGVILVGDIRQ
jgi:hypothetical protein